MTSPTQDRLDGISTSVAVKAPVKAVSAANHDLTGEQTVGGVACVTGDRVLLKDQTAGAENGIWCVNTSTWSRALDFNGNRDAVQGTLVIQADTSPGPMYQLTTAGTITIGTTALTFTLASSPTVTFAAMDASGDVGSGAGQFMEADQIADKTTADTISGIWNFSANPTFASATGTRTNLGIGTGDSPQLAGVNVGHASDTTLTRKSAGVLQIEINEIYSQGSTDVAVTDGGTGASDAGTARTNLGVGAGNIPQFVGVHFNNADTTLTRKSAGVLQIEANEVYAQNGTDVAIADGGTGQSTAQDAINALSQVSGATDDYVLTKSNVTGDAEWAAPQGAGVGEDNLAENVTGGGGVGLWKDKNVTSLRFKSLLGTGIEIASGTDDVTLSTFLGACSQAELTSGDIDLNTANARIDLDVKLYENANLPIDLTNDRITNDTGATQILEVTLSFMGLPNVSGDGVTIPFWIRLNGTTQVGELLPWHDWQVLTTGAGSSFVVNQIHLTRVVSVPDGQYITAHCSTTAISTHNLNVQTGGTLTVKVVQ